LTEPAPIKGGIMKKVFGLVLIALIFLSHQVWAQEITDNIMLKGEVVQPGMPDPDPQPAPKPIPEPTPESQPAPAETIVDLTLNKSVSTPWHVNSGVPLRKGLLASTANLTLTDKRNNPVPAQFQILSKWEDDSIKSVLVTALLDSPETDYKIVRLEKQKEINGIKIKQNQDNIEIDTGAKVFTINKNKLDLMGGEIFLIDNKTKIEYSSNRGTPTYTVEENPIRSIIKAEGHLTALDNTELTKYLVRFYFYAKRDYVVVDYTLIDDRPEYDARSYNKPTALEVEGYGIRFPKKMAHYKTATETQVFEAQYTEPKYLLQLGSIDFVNGQLKGYDFSLEGMETQDTKAEGWIEVNDLSISVKNFWQQFPKEFEINNNELIVWLHPKKASAKPGRFNAKDKRYDRPQIFYSSREGVAKTHSILIKSNDIEETQKVFQDSPRLLASSEYYGATKVFGDIIPAGNYSAAYDGYIENRTYDLSTTHLKLYGDRDFGGRMYPGYGPVIVDGVRFPTYYNGTHTGATTFCQQYIRTMNEKWWGLCEGDTLHVRDRDVYHNRRHGLWRDWTKPNGPSYLTSPGELAADTHRATDHFARGVHEGHAHMSGLYEHYMLTGDSRSLDVIKEMGDWWVEYVPKKYRPTASESHMAEAERDYAWPQNVLNQAYRATGDPKYLKSSVTIVEHCLAWWKVKKDHTQDRNYDGKIDPEEIVEVFDYTKGTGYWWLSHNANTPNNWNGPNPWQGAALISNILQTLELDHLDTKLLDRAEVLDMLFQTMNQIVKWGYDEEKNVFYYVVTGKFSPKGTVDGGRHFYYPLARLYEIYKTEQLVHKEWYTTIEMWDDIVKKFYTNQSGEVSTRSSKGGFYGYEMVWPADFWAVMQRLINQG